MATFIRPIAEGTAGEASRITVQAFNDSEVLTALRNGSGNPELISWHTDPQDNPVTRGADSGALAVRPMRSPSRSSGERRSRRFGAAAIICC
jgi:hypothetical protein